MGVIVGEYRSGVEGVYTLEMRLASYSLSQSTQVMVNRYKENRIHIEVGALCISQIDGIRQGFLSSR